MNLVSTLVLIGIIAVVLFLLTLLISKQYNKVGPNEVLIISGGRKKKHTQTRWHQIKNRLQVPAGRGNICLAPARNRRYPSYRRD